MLCRLCKFSGDLPDSVLENCSQSSGMRERMLTMTKEYHKYQYRGEGTLRSTLLSVWAASQTRTPLLLLSRFSRVQLCATP